MTGGTFGLLSVGRDNQTTISGGVFNGDFRTLADSQVTISGGSFGDGVEVRADSNVTLVGGEFRLNGTAYSDGTISLNEGDTFTGVFEDGSAFVFSDLVDDSLVGVNLSTAPVPIPTITNFAIDSEDPDGAPLSLRSGQTLSVVEGGSLTNILESVGGAININGGSLGRVTTSQSSIDQSGGVIDTLSVLANGQVDVSDGSIDEIFLSSSNASFSGNDTSIGNVTAESSQVDFQDVIVFGSIFNTSDSVLNISGDATIRAELNVSNSEINISDNATLTGRFSNFRSSQN